MAGSLANPKNSRKGDFWVSKPPIVDLVASILSIHGSARKIKSFNCWPGHIYTLFLWQMVEIFVLYSKDPKLRKLFLFLKIFIRR